MEAVWRLQQIWEIFPLSTVAPFCHSTQCTSVNWLKLKGAYLPFSPMPHSLTVYSHNSFFEEIFPHTTYIPWYNGCSSIGDTTDHTVRRRSWKCWIQDLCMKGVLRLFIVAHSFRNDNCKLNVCNTSFCFHSFNWLIYWVFFIELAMHWAIFIKNWWNSISGRQCQHITTQHPSDWKIKGPGWKNVIWTAPAPNQMQTL